VDDDETIRTTLAEALQLEGYAAPRDLALAARTIAEGTVLGMDIGRVGDRPFLNAEGLGPGPELARVLLLRSTPKQHSLCVRWSR
jgi:hypothetical protein